jgi:hypothetical protein
LGRDVVERLSSGDHHPAVYLVLYAGDAARRACRTAC